MQTKQTLPRLFIATIACGMVLLSADAIPVEERGVSFVQLCDPQLGMTDFKEDICSLEQAVKQVNLLAPDCVIICGDLVDKANSNSYSNFCKIMEGCSVPFLCLPGNHDLGLPPTPESLQRYRKTIGPDYSSTSISGFRFIMLNTVLFKSPLPEEMEKEMKWLTDQLEQAQQKKERVLVAGHYPLFYLQPQEPEGWQSLPARQRDALSALFQAYGVRVMMTGHTHCYIENRDGGILFLSGESTSKNIDGRPLGFRFWQASPGGECFHKFIPIYRRKQVVPKPPYDPGAESGTAAQCLANLRLIDAVKDAVGMTGGLTNSTEISETDVSASIKGGLKSLTCPDGGKYAIGRLGEDPECSIGGHKLPYFYQYEEFLKRAHNQSELRKHPSWSAGRPDPDKR